MPKTVSNLTELLTLKDDDLLEAVDSTESNLALKSKKIKASTIKAYMGSGSTNFTEWDILTTYTVPTPPDVTYVSHLSNIYEFVSPVSNIGTEPGTDSLIWSLTSAGALSHERNKDQYLDYGGTNQVAASEIVKKPSISSVIVSVGGAASINLGLKNIKYFEVSGMAGDFTINVSNMAECAIYRIVIVSGISAAIKITFGSGFTNVYDLNNKGATVSDITLDAGTGRHELVLWTHFTSGSSTDTYASYTRSYRLNHVIALTDNTGFANYFTMANAVATSQLVMGVAGTDTNISWRLGAKGTGKIYFDSIIDANSKIINNVADPVSAQDAATKNYVDSSVVGLWDDRGAFDASVNAYPSSGGSGSSGAILKGDIWTISVAGTLPTGQVVEPGDTVRALANTPGNTQANWSILQNNIGYTPVTNARTLSINGSTQDLSANRTWTLNIPLEVTNSTVISQLTNNSNWTNNRYSGSTISGQKSGDFYEDGTYFYKFFTTSVIRIPYTLL